MELLAPAGNVENFHVALEAGADSVYIGAPQLNARNLARDLSLEEITGMIRFAHDRGRKVYIAVNSLIRETDLPQLLKTLACLEIAGPDALIIQDLGVIRLVNSHFPSLRLHGSTLMTAHNRDGVVSLAQLGCSRVVIAREMTLKELTRITSSTDVEVEIFVHGAMCFSYSGLCLFSSYHGGKSGLRGNCVQPCRRKFSLSAGKPKSGYIFSMNDLSGLEMIAQFKRINIASLKIEGRLRSAAYVQNVVGAYRMVLDGGEDDHDEVLREASAMLETAMGRKTSSGYFLTPQPKDAIVQHHSGNIGNYLGRIDTTETLRGECFAVITLKESCEVGERLRLHFDKSGEREAFTLSGLVVGGMAVKQAERGARVRMVLPARLKAAAGAAATDVYRVDVKKTTSPSRSDYRPQELSARQTEKIGRKLNRLRSLGLGGSRKQAEAANRNVEQGRSRGTYGSELWLRLDSPQLIYQKLPFNPDRYVFNLQKNSLSGVGRIKQYLGRVTRSVIWALPPIVHDSTIHQLRKTLRSLIKSGFRSFQLAHISQVDLFEGEKVHLFGDYSLNLLNSQAMRMAQTQGLKGLQCCIEADRDCLARMVTGFRQPEGGPTKNNRQDQTTVLGLTVFGSPPLFTSRIAADHFSYGRGVVSPKNEEFVIEKRGGYTQTRPKKSFSLLPYRHELEAIGIQYVVVDLSGLKPGRKELQDLGSRIANKGKLYRLPTFNYLGTLE